jgi:hypothetical protein
VVIGANLGYRFYAHHLDRFYNCDWGLVRKTSRLGSAGAELPAGSDDPARVA